MISILYRFIINFILSALVVLFFNWLGWINFVNPPTFVDNQFLNSIIIAGIISIVISIVGEILGIFYKIIKTIFFMFGCIIAIIYFFISGYLKLWIASLILTDWFSYSYDLLAVLIISFAIGAIRLPQKDEMKEEMKEYKKWKKNQEK